MAIRADEWARGLAEFRQAKDAFFARHPQSPLTEEQRRGFDRLSYFPANPALRFEAVRLRDAGGDAEIVMETSTGGAQRYRRAATVDLEIDGTLERVTLYASSAGHSLFLPFADATSGTETYGGGRYLDIEAQGPTVDIDFNYAYNPYCAYNQRWACPLPPAENRLYVPVRAGEQAFGGASH